MTMVLARAVQCQPSDVALSSKVQLASPLHASAQVARTKLAGNAATFSGVPPAAAGGRAGARDLRFLRATRTCNPHRSSSRRTRSREAHGPLRVARAQHRGLRADGFSVEFRSARRESRVRDENGNARRRAPRQSNRHDTVRARSRPTRVRQTRRTAVEPRVARARARARAFSAPLPAKTHEPLDSLYAQARLGTTWLGLMGPPMARPMRRTRRLRAPVSSRRRNPRARACFPIQRAIRAC